MKVRIKLLAVPVLLLSFMIPCFAESTANTESGTVSAERETIAFSDIAGHWAEATITKWQNSGIINGYPDGTFRPDDYVTRAELAKIVTLAFGLDGTTELEFSDLDSDAWYYEYTLAAADYIPTYCPPDSNYATMGYKNNDGKFFPEAPALRFHSAGTFSMLKIERDGLTIEYPSIYDIHDAVTKRFKDGQYYSLYIVHPGKQDVAGNVAQFQTDTWLVSELGLMQGDPDGYFRPYDSLTRAEVLTILDRIIEPQKQ